MTSVTVGRRHSKHDSEELVSQRKFVLANPIVRGRRPAAATLFSGMQAVTRNQLHQHIHERLRGSS